MSRCCGSDQFIESVIRLPSTCFLSTALQQYTFVVATTCCDVQNLRTQRIHVYDQIVHIGRNRKLNGVSLPPASPPSNRAVVCPATTVRQVGFPTRTRTGGGARPLTATLYGLSVPRAVHGWPCTSGRRTSTRGTGKQQQSFAGRLKTFLL